MSTKARKDRKRAGEPFVKAPKVGTPLQNRASFNGFVPGAPGTRWAGRMVPRSQKLKDRALAARTEAIKPTRRRGLLSGLFSPSGLRGAAK